MRQRVQWTLAAVLCFAAGSAFADDRDGNGVDDAIEGEILQAFAPIYRTDEAGGREYPPVSVDWYVRHCFISRWTEFYSGTGGPADEILPRIAENFTLTLDYFNNTLAASGEVGNNTPNQPQSGYWRLWFKNTNYHRGNDPQEPRSWAISQQTQDVLYGRVNRFGLSGNQYIVQYFMFFPWNDIDADRFWGCPAGNHEGDISCVEYMVEYNSPGSTRILQGIHHDHGRQVFAEPGSLQYINGRPVVFPENENHESMPWPASCGIVQGMMPPGIAANELFRSHDILTVPIAGECDDAPVVREHNGSTFTLQINTVKNLHEKNAPADMHSAESLFVARYAGLYGHYANDTCDIFTWPVRIDDFEAPQGPTFQGKMWDRSYRRPDVWVSLGTTAVEQIGDANKPVSSVARAVAMAVPGATVHINAGVSSERLTISLPLTLRAEGGPVTIGH